MATYPTTLLVLRSSSTDIDDGFDPTRATNGMLRVRQRYPAEKTNFTVEHMLSTADKTTLMSFYSTNKALDVSLVWPEDGATYTVRFVAKPTAYRTPGFWLCRVKLREV